MHNIDIDSLRCVDDNIEDYEDIFVTASKNMHAQRMHLLSTSLKATKEITPSIDKVIKKILTRLNLDNIGLECYIYNDPSMNASCFSLDNSVDLLIMVSSGLVNKMTEDELAFVLGHEVGHYLFGHLDYAEIERKKSELEDLKIGRLYQAQEISADRIGFICSGSVDSSLRAIIKTVSGLNDEFITHNLHTYLHQIKSLKFDSLINASYTHPIFPIRAKALMLFSMSELYYLWSNELKQAPISTEKLTNKIRRDLESTTLKNLKNESDHVVEKFKLWFFVKSFIEDDNLDRKEIEYLNKIFGEETAKKAIMFSQSNPSAINKKYEEYRIQMTYLPKSYQIHLFNEMKESVSSIMSDHVIHRYFNNIEKSIVGDHR